MSNKKIRAVLFDFGETMITFGKVDTAHLFVEGARLTYDFLKSNGVHVGNFKFYCVHNLISLHLRHLISSITGNDFDSLRLLKKIAGKPAKKLNDQQWKQLVWLWYEPLSKAGKPEPDIAQTLAALKRVGLKLGILSNTFVPDSVLERHLEQFGLLDYFDVRIYSYQFPFRKPDRRIFQDAAVKLGEKCENIIFVGDRLDNDIAPALKLEMTAVLKSAYTNKGKKTPQLAHKIKNLSELPDLIEKINAAQN